MSSTSGDPNTAWQVLQNVVVPYISEDLVVVKLWCTCARVQELLKKSCQELSCVTRISNRISSISSTCSTGSLGKISLCMNPSFLFQLTAIKYLKLSITEAALSFITIYQNLGLREQFNNLVVPDSLTALEITHPQLFISPNRPFNIMRQHPQLRLITSEQSKDSACYNNMLNHFITSITKDFVPLNSASYFSSLESSDLSKLRTVWDKLDEKVREWLTDHWCPHVRKIKMGTALVDRDASLELWSYQTFPNIEEVVNGITAHPGIRNYTSLYGPAPSNIYCSAQLTTLDLVVTIDDVAREILPNIPATGLPQSLRSLTLTISLVRRESYNIFNSTAVKLISTFPRKLEHLSFQIEAAPQIFCPTGKLWTDAMVSGLPRGLLTFVTHDMFNSDPDLCQLLPPRLTKFSPGWNTIEEQSSYLLISDRLTRLNYTLCSDAWAGQLNILNRFQNLVKLTLTIEERDKMEWDNSILASLKLPESLRTLNLNLQGGSSVGDIFSCVTLPQKLEELVIQGLENVFSDGTVMHGADWKPFPDTLQSIVLGGLEIFSLPPKWPSRLLFLDLAHSVAIIGDGTYSLDSAEIVNDPQFKASLMSIPPGCVVYIDRDNEWIQYKALTVDIQAGSLYSYNIDQ